jgi:hypothetical protein
MCFCSVFPGPEVPAQAGKRHWQMFLHSRRLWGSDEAPAAETGDRN